MGRSGRSEISLDPPERVVVTWIDFDLHDPDIGGRLRDAGLEVVLAPKIGARSPAELAGLMADAVGAIVSTDPFERSVFTDAPRLRAVARVGVGTDSIDVAAATEAGVVVTTTRGANTETAADHTLAIMLAAVRRIVEHDASVRRGEWRRAGALTPWDLHRTTVGLVGFGAIGRAVEKRLAGFGTRVLVTDPALRCAGAGTRVELDELLARCQVVSLHLPLVDSTRGIIGRDELYAMRPDALLVNTSRGGLVDEDALVDVLEQHRIRGAALDVFADEPAMPPRLRALSNVVLTPHVAGLSDRSIRAMTSAAVRSLLEVLSGRASRESVVNPAALDHPRHVPVTATLGAT